MVGPHGCGKSTVIHKGLKQCYLGLAEEVTVDIESGRGAFTCASPSWSMHPPSHTYSDTTRRGVMSANLTGETECSLRVLEADISPFNLNDTRGIWADVTGVWDGIVICFDVTDANSVGHVEDLLRELPDHDHCRSLSHFERRDLQSCTLRRGCMQVGARACCPPRRCSCVGQAA